MAKAVEHEFDASAGHVYQALLTAVTEAGYSVGNTDRDSRSISFQTGMSMKSWSGQAMTATVLPLGDSRAKVSAGGIRKRTFGRPAQVYDWGEKGKIAEKLFSRIDELLPNVAETTPPATAQRTSTSEEITRLAELHRTGALTDEEFSAAKAKLLG
jgi:hypothetical protein